MLNRDRLEALKDLWRDAHDEGHNMSASELCSSDDSTELIEALEDFIFDRLECEEIWEHCDNPDCLAAYRPKSIGRYQVREELGSGGFGTVYLAHDDTLKRNVAIKVPNPEFIANATEFSREAQLLAQLRHPNIVAVFDSGQERLEVPGLPAQDVCYIVTEYIEGRSLAKRLKATKPTPYEAAKLVADLCEALDIVHAARVYHRDIKPGNIMVDGNWKPVLIDFGIALTKEAPGNRTGYTLTPAYTSPEQAMRQVSRIDHRSDIFSVGVVLYEMLTGHRPFAGTTNHEVLRSVGRCHVTEPMEIDPSIPPDLNRVCMKALAKQQENRYQSAGDMARALRGHLGHHDKFAQHEFHELVRELFEVEPGQSSEAIMYRRIKALVRYLEDLLESLPASTATEWRNRLRTLAKQLQRPK